jgi:hypothetical protein
VLVLFGMGIYSSRRSFPRKRESSPTTAHFQRFAEWILASAGMTGASAGMTGASAGMTALQMTPLLSWEQPFVCAEASHVLTFWFLGYVGI